MKKTLAILLAFTMLLSLTAYGSSTAPASGSTKSFPRESRLRVPSPVL